MADAYGTIIVCGDYEGDLNAIVNVLNWLKLTSDRAQFQVHKDEREYIYLDSHCVQYPTLSPSRRIYVFEDGRQVSADDADEVVIQEWEDNDGDLDYGEPYTLEELSSLISPHLRKGTLELVAVANEKDTYAFCERLVIRSDGTADWHLYYADGCSTARWRHSVSDHYDPRANKRAA